MPREKYMISPEVKRAVWLASVEENMDINDNYIALIEHKMRLEGFDRPITEYSPEIKVLMSFLEYRQDVVECQIALESMDSSFTVN